MATSNAQHKNNLSKLIKSNTISSEQQVIVDYLKLNLSDVITKWMSGADDADALRGEANCLVKLIRLLTNSNLELVTLGDNNE